MTGENFQRVGCNRSCGCLFAIAVAIVGIGLLSADLGDLFGDLFAGRAAPLIFGALAEGNNGLFGVGRWTFEGAAGSGVSITLDGVGDDYDPLVRLLGPDGAEIASDDDGGSGLNAAIECFVLPLDGQYTVVADGYDGDTGDYRLMVSVVEAKLPRRIEYGQTIEETLTQCAQVFTFRGDEGDIVWVSARSDAFDTTLRLFDSSGLELGFNDDADGRNAELQGIVLPRAGDYQIVLKPYFDGDTGHYELRLSEGE